MRRTVHAMVLAVILSLPALPAAASVTGVWEQLHPGQFMSVAVAPSPVPGEPSIILAGSPNSGGTLRSTDGGLSWTVAFPVPAWSLAVDPQIPGRVYAATPGGLYRTDDHGTTWTNMNSFVRSWVLVNPADSQTIYGDNYMSMDGGLNWMTMSGLSGFQPRNAEAPHIVVSPGRPNTLYAININSTFRSTNGGVSWTVFGVSGKHDTIAVDPVDGRWVYIGNCNSRCTRYYDDAYVGDFLLSSHTHGIVVDPSAPNVLYALTNSGHTPMRSSDNGASWTTYNAGLSGTTFGMVTEGRLIFDGTDGSIYVPTSAGLWKVATWGDCTDADGDLFFGEGGCGTALDCDDTDPLVHPGAAEECTDGIDNDCDSLVDAADPGAVNCPCTDADGDLFYGELNCGTAPDCDDADPLVNPGAAEVCTDGADNDCDGLADAADPDCPAAPACGDYLTKTECVADPNCEWAGNPKSGTCQDRAICTVTESPETSCADGADNDCDGLTDGDDPDCGGGTTGPEICDDGIDNDGDGKTDCADKGDCRKDPSCN